MELKVEFKCNTTRCKPYPFPFPWFEKITSDLITYIYILYLDIAYIPSGYVLFLGYESLFLCLSFSTFLSRLA